MNDPLVTYFIFALTTIIPVIQVFRRAGLMPGWSVLLFVPYAGLALVCGVLAIQEWPVRGPIQFKKRKKQ